jgi:hypothetical protein
MEINKICKKCRKCFFSFHFSHEYSIGEFCISQEGESFGHYNYEKLSFEEFKKMPHITDIKYDFGDYIFLDGEKYFITDKVLELVEPFFSIIQKTLKKNCIYQFERTILD